jgi:hypothetical protein
VVGTLYMYVVKLIGLIYYVIDLKLKNMI